MRSKTRSPRCAWPPRKRWRRRKDPESAALLIARVDHPEPFVRAAALRTVRELVTPEALPAALRALKDQSPEVRREAIGVLGYLKADQALPALMAAAGDADPRSGAQ